MFVKNLLNSSAIFFVSKMSVLLTVILVGRVEDFVDFDLLLMVSNMFL